MAMDKKTADKIGSIDEYGNRLYLQPAEVTGFWRNWRTRIQYILILVFLLTPWTTMNGHQTILIDIADREFYILGAFFRAHNTPLLFFLILGATISLAFVTSIWGRVWCGWACPQTVFIDGVYRKIEYYIEGNYLARRKMQTEPLTPSIFFKKLTKWILFIIVSSFIAHSFLAYFVGAWKFREIIEQGPSAHMTTFIVAQFFTVLFLFDFGWFKEQFCTVACPYGRFQGILLDKSSLAVVYDEKRDSDCVKCNRCVSACPIGIDIRNGLQMECIACTACIDACDEIMEKVKKPKGLVKYDTLDGSKITITKTRSLLYLLIIFACIGGLTYNLVTKKHSQAFVLRGIEAPFKVSEVDQRKIITNHFRLHVTNQSFEPKKYKIELVETNLAELVAAEKEITLQPKEFKEWHLFLQVKGENFKPNMKLHVNLIDIEKPADFTKNFELQILGPAE